MSDFTPAQQDLINAAKICDLVCLLEQENAALGQNFSHPGRKFQLAERILQLWQKEGK